MANKSKTKKKMTQEKKSAHQVRRDRQQNVARVGALVLVAVMILSLVAMYAFR